MLIDPEEPLFEDIFETIRESLLMLDLDLRILKANRSFYDTFKVISKETIGNLIYDIGNREWDIPLLRALLENILPENNKFDNYEVEHVFPSIGHKIMLLNARRVFQKEIGPQVILLAIEDITEHKRMVGLLEESEERYRRLFETANDGILLLEKHQGNITHANPAVIKMLGYAKEEFVGHKLLDVGFPPDMDGIEEIMHGLQENGILYYDDIPIKTKAMQEIDTDTYLVDRARLIQCNIRDITERKKAEEKLLESEKKYRDLYDFLPIPVYEMDLEANITSVNRSIYETFRGTEEDLKRGFKAWQLLSPEDIDKSIRNIERLLKGEKIQDTEYSLMRLDGSVFPAIVISSVIYNNGKPVGLRGAIIDITERKQREEEQRRMNAFLASIVENIPNMIFLKDARELRFVRFNRAGEDLLGLSRDDLLGKNDYDFFPKEQADFFTEKDQDVLHGKKVVDIPEEPIQTRTKGERILHTKKVPILNVNGEPEYLLGISEDITERKQAETALCESEERYKALFDRSLDCVYLTDFEGRFLDANQAALDLLGYQLEEISKLTFTSLLTPDQLSLAFQMAEEIRTTGYQKSLTEYRLRRKDEEAVFVEIQSSLIYRDGKPFAIQSIARDITARKQAEEELATSLNKIRKAMGGIIQATASMVETRDPYTAGHQRRVADLARSIAQEMGLPEDQVDGLRMAGLIHDLGKIAVPAEILSKPTKLSELEFALIKVHSEAGYEILKDIEFPWPIARMVLEHHERIDGSGYPKGLKGDKLLLETKILNVADVVEAIASHRPYRPAHGIDAAMEEISKNRGILYDPEVVDVCLRLFKEKGFKLD